MVRVVVAGGGTGGHLFPGIAVVEEMRRQGLAPEVTFVGTERGIEARVLPKLGETLRCVEVRPLKGRGPWELIRNLGRLPSSGIEAVQLLRELRPDLVLGVGGYASGPILAAALTMRVPTALMEQNAVPGLTNRVLVRHVGRAYASFEETFSVASDHVVVSGNPIRRALVDVAHARDMDPEALRPARGQILVLGGSQGARALNEHLPALLGAALGQQSRPVRVVHQVGRGDVARVKAVYNECGIESEVVEFIDNIAEYYERSELVIARAGASTVAELCALGCPSVLVPFPHAADDHQSKNALALARAGAAVQLAEAELHSDEAVQVVRTLWNDDARRRAMSASARRFGKPDAAATIVDDLSAWLGWGAGPNTRRRTRGTRNSGRDDSGGAFKSLPPSRSAAGLRGAENNVFGRRRPYIPSNGGTAARRAERLSDEPVVPFVTND